VTAVLFGNLAEAIKVVINSGSFVRAFFKCALASFTRPCFR
jgi:hypothetical protein